MGTSIIPEPAKPNASLLSKLIKIWNWIKGLFKRKPPVSVISETNEIIQPPLEVTSRIPFKLSVSNQILADLQSLREAKTDFSENSAGGQIKLILANGSEKIVKYLTQALEGPGDFGLELTEENGEIILRLNYPRTDLSLRDPKRRILCSQDMQFAHFTKYWQQSQLEANEVRNTQNRSNSSLQSNSLDQTMDQISGSESEINPVFISDQRLDNITWYDFSDYRLLQDAQYEILFSDPIYGIGYRNPLEGSIHNFNGHLVFQVNNAYSSSKKSGNNSKMFQRPRRGIDSIYDGIHIAPRPYEPYPFSLYKFGSVYLGQRLLYRQEWRTMGDQRGEIVRTLPLGPKQIEKVSTKIVKRTKLSHTSEDLRSVETTTDTADTTKTSAEIVKEATSSSKWHAEAEASANFGGFGGVKASSGYESSAANSVKSNATRLNETMQKTASKVSTQSKVIVSTETESTFETSTASEIQNPNDEISVTYIYSKLQRQYQVFTSLAELDMVIMVAEKVPYPDQVNESWIRKYDYIISRSLLDDSFRETLSLISQDVDPEMGLEDYQNVVDQMANASARLSNLSGSISQIDLLATSLESDRATRKDHLEKLRAINQAQQKRQRFIEHIKNNILHYMRAIWSQEDPDQRVLRYRQMGIITSEQQTNNVSSLWRFEFTAEAFKEVIKQDQTHAKYLVGKFQSVITDESLNYSVADIIDPRGPIGFVGNCAVFRIKPEFSNDYFNLLQAQNKDYIEWTEEGFSVVDPELKELTEFYNKFPNKIPNIEQANKRLKKEMIDFVPYLRLNYAYAVAEGDVTETEFFSNWDDNFKPYYAEYIFRKRRTHNVPIDTDNLVIDIIPGEGSTLEAFKRAHRSIDAQKALYEAERIRLENERRKKLLEQDKLGDPNIEKVIIITSQDQVEALKGLLQNTVQDS